MICANCGHKLEGFGLSTALRWYHEGQLTEKRKRHCGCVNPVPLSKEAKEMNEKSIEILAEEHAEWCAEFLKWVYKQAFVHGYKHGQQAEKEAKKTL